MPIVLSFFVVWCAPARFAPCRGNGLFVDGLDVVGGQVFDGFFRFIL
jgi:hypothetical protein